MDQVASARDAGGDRACGGGVGCGEGWRGGGSGARAREAPQRLRSSTRSPSRGRRVDRPRLPPARPRRCSVQETPRSTEVLARRGHQLPGGRQRRLGLRSARLDGLGRPDPDRSSTSTVGSRSSTSRETRWLNVTDSAFWSAVLVPSTTHRADRSRCRVRPPLPALDHLRDQHRRPPTTDHARRQRRADDHRHRPASPSTSSARSPARRHGEVRRLPAARGRRERRLHRGEPVHPEHRHVRRHHRST